MLYLSIIALVVSICAITLSIIVFTVYRNINKIIKDLIVSNNGNVKLITSLNETAIKTTKDVKELAELISKISDIVTKLSQRPKSATTKKKAKTSD